ncbi:MAG: glycosyltransferase [Actinobacteria bacterium]|nr:glycosyltransferase [Actinomycetota bacterium]
MKSAATPQRRILVNAVAARIGGGARHIANFADALRRELSSDVAIDVLAPPSVSLPVRGVTHIPTEIPQGAHPRRLRWELWDATRLASTASALLSPMNFGPPILTVPHVLWQRNPTYFDEGYLHTCDIRRRTVVAAYRQWALLCVRRADAIIVPSQAMLDMLASFVSIDERFHIVPHGWKPTQPASVQLPSVAKRWRGFEPRLLYVSTPAAHKNVELLPEILQRVKRVHPHAGLGVTFNQKSQWPAVDLFRDRVERHQLGESIVYLGTVAQDAVYQLYSEADLVLYPSLTESFGFPLVEAMGGGAPIAASSIPSNHEVAANLATYHDPQDPDSAGDAALRALASGRPPALVHRRVARAKSFSWSANAQRVVAIIESLQPSLQLRA